MSERSIELRLRINFPAILFAVLAMHAVVMGTRTLERLGNIGQGPRGNNRNKSSKLANSPFKLRDIRTVGSKESRKHDSMYLAKTPFKTNQISDKKYGQTPSPSQALRPVPPKKSLSLSDLQDNKPVVAKKVERAVRPGTRPQVAKAALEKTKTLPGISLKGQEIGKFARAESANSLSGDPRAQSLSNSDILVNLEVPEGVNPDELNQYELMFYGFQRRTAIGYVNSFYKQLDKFQRENPHKQFPMISNKQIMTGRLTYDNEGNIKQIKMIRWSNNDDLQGFFETVLKDMDTLHNPPRALWEKAGEFSIFFSLVVNG
jgi:hypothetical protein